MNDNLLLYILYGFVAGFSQNTPLSASAHQALFPMILRFDSVWPLLRFFVHAGALGAIIFLNWKQISHLYQEMKIAAIHPKRRSRMPDLEAVLDIRLVSVACIPVFIGAILSAFTASADTSLLLLAVMLVLGAVTVYVPEYVPGGDRKIRSMSSLDGIILGVCAAASVIPGVSAVGLMLFACSLRKCDKKYILDIIFLICGLMLATVMAVDFISFVFTGFSGITLVKLIGCLLACAASFGGSISAILTTRFLIVKDGLSGFAYYGWGLGLFSLILYLLV